MIISHKKFFTTIIFTLCCFIFSIANLWAGEYKITQLTDNGYDDGGRYKSQIHNGQVVWGGYDGNDYEIFLYDGKETIQLTDNDYSDASPQIHNGLVVWYGARRIFLYDGKETIQLTDSAYRDRYPQVHNGQVVWERWESNDNCEIFLYDGNQTIQLTDNGYHDRRPYIYNGQVTWMGYDGNDWEIFLYDGIQTIQLTDNDYRDGRFAQDNGPKIHNGQVVWEEERFQIFFYDGNQTIQLTNSDYGNYSPQIHNDQITWYGFDGDSSPGIFFYDGNQIIQLNDSRVSGYLPQIHNGQVVWRGNGISLYDGNQIVQFPFGWGYPKPKIHNGQVVWSGYDGNDYEIYLATPASTTFTLTETSFIINTLSETILAQDVTLNNVNVTGNLSGTVSFSDFEIVRIDSGSFKGHGFFKANWQAELDGSSYTGSYKGMIYPDPDERKIYLKGSLSGDLIGITETALTESTPDSGIYDKYGGTWTLSKIQEQDASDTLDIKADISYDSDLTFTSSIYFYQANLEGAAKGYYVGGMSAVLTHLRLTSADTYNNEGFSIISYTTDYASGNAWVYNQYADEIVEFAGLSKEPLSGVFSAELDEAASPKTLTGRIERLDLGKTYAPHLKVELWGPGRVSPGDTVTYTIEYRNDGVKKASNVFVSCYLSTFVKKYISASEGANYSPYAHRITWKLGPLAPKAKGYLTFDVEVVWRLPEGFPLNHYAFITNIEPHSEIKGVIGTGLLTDSSNPDEKEILEGIAKIFDTKVVWTYDKTNLIDGPLEAKAAEWNIPTSVNGLEDPLLSELSGYQERVIMHSACTRTVVTLAKQGKIWGDKLYLVSPVLISQKELRTVRDLAVQGKGFNEIVVYTGDNMIWDFKKVAMDFVNYVVEGYITETIWFPIEEIKYEYRGRQIDLLREFLDYYSNTVKEKLGKEPLSVTIYGNIPGNQFEINWKDGTTEISYLQKDTVTGEDFQDEDSIEIVSLYEGFPHGMGQLELLGSFYEEHGRLPGKDDIELFKKTVETYRWGTESIATTARDPNEKFVFPEGNIMPGDTLTYTITYENEGEGTAYGVYITDTLNQYLDDTTLSINDGIGTYDSETRTITWLVGEVGPAEEGSFTFSVNLKEEVQDNTEIINFATVYFPSVPEETRTNSVVNMVSTSTDNIPPVTQISISPSANQAGWHNTDITVTLTATDNEGGSGVKEIYYQLTGAINEEGTISGDTSDIYIITEGITTLTYYAIDNEGNQENPQSKELKLDKTSPTVNITATPDTLWPPNRKMVDVSIGGEAIDTLSGIAQTIFRVTDEYGEIEPEISDFNTTIQLEAWRNGDDLDGRIYTISVTAKDKADNEASSSITVICPHDQRGKR